jgi:DtxR family transcriptional regulator, Mn-dependent transcriptional regulator
LNTLNKPSLTPKMKDYLVGISEIEEKKPVARMGEIADVLGVKGPSAHVMVKMLAERKLVKYEKYGYVNLTEEGIEIADQLKLTNDLIKNFFVKFLGIDEKTATEDARRVRNVLSYGTFVKLKKYLYFLENRADHRETNIPEEVDKFSEK